jgi:acetoin utilization deacetylase AcuC-like enzyme
VHQENLYPVKQKSSLDVGLPDYAGDDLYVKAFQEHIPVIYEQHHPDLIAYIAGADPYKEDQLGNLQVTMEGLKKRDEIVIGEARKRSIPFFVVLAGGYSRNTEDVVNIHFQTLAIVAGVRP